MDREAAGLWRRYPRVEGVRKPGIDAARTMAPVNRGIAKGNRHRQLELRRTTGFSGDRADVGHQVTWLLLRRGFSKRAAHYAGHLVATAREWNFQGMRRLGFWARLSARTLRRARAELEAAGLIVSHLIMPGEQVRGQRGPVLRPHVVRDVRPLWALIGERAFAKRANIPRGGRQKARKSPSDRKPSGAPASTEGKRRRARKPKPSGPPVTAAEYEASAAAATDPKLAAMFRTMAQAARTKEAARLEPPPPPPPSWEDVDYAALGFVETDVDLSGRAAFFQAAADTSASGEITADMIAGMQRIELEQPSDEDMAAWDAENAELERRYQEQREQSEQREQREQSEQRERAPPR